MDSVDYIKIILMCVYTFALGMYVGTKAEQQYINRYYKLTKKKK